MRGVCLSAVFPCSTIAPRLAEQVYQGAGRHAVAVIRADIIIAGVPVILILALGDQQVRRQRFQHMLVWAGGIRVAHTDALLFCHRAHAVRDDAVIGKIAAANHITCAGSGDGHAAIRKKAVFIAVGHQLRAAFAVGVGVEAVQRFVFAVAPAPFIILVHLIRCYVQHRARRSLGGAHAFQQVHGAHHIGFIGIAWVLVAVPHNGLGRQVQHNFRSSGIKGRFQAGKIADVTDHAGHFAFQPCQREEVGGCGRFQAVTRYHCTGTHQHAADPAAFKTGMPGYKHAFAAVKFQVHCWFHTSQGARPDAHIFSSILFSRSVSMHCQNPRCT